MTKEDKKEHIMLFCRTKVAGISFCNPPWAELTPETKLSLTREPENEHDPNAIRIDFKDTKIGYINRHVAEDLHRLIDGERFEVWADVLQATGGTDEKQKGLNIAVRYKYIGE
jgi:hypothetical protein